MQYSLTTNLLNKILDYIYKKKINFFLAKIYGIKITTIANLLIKIGISKNSKINELRFSKFLELINFINFEGKQKISYQIDHITKKKFLYELNTNKARRLNLGLPANGQRTRSNGKTAKYLLKK